MLLKIILTILFFRYFDHDLNRGCLVYMFSLRFSGSKFLINLRRQSCVRKFSARQLRTQVYAGFGVFSFVFKIFVSKMRCNKLLL